MKIRAHLGTIVLVLAVAGVAVPAALGSTPRDGRSPDTKDAAIAAHLSGGAVVTPVDGRSPDTKDAAALARLSSLVPLDGRSPDTVDAGLSAQQNLLAPVDGRSPDTVDAAIQAHSPFVTIVKSGGFSWGDFGIGFGVAVGSLLLLAGLGVGLAAARQSGKAGPATTA